MVSKFNSLLRAILTRLATFGWSFCSQIQTSYYTKSPKHVLGVPCAKSFGVCCGIKPECGNYWRNQTRKSVSLNGVTVSGKTSRDMACFRVAEAFAANNKLPFANRNSFAKYVFCSGYHRDVIVINSTMNGNNAEVWGTARFSLEWIEQLYEIAPSVNLPSLRSEQKHRVLIFLPKWHNLVKKTATLRLLTALGELSKIQLVIARSCLWSRHTTDRIINYRTSHIPLCGVWATRLSICYMK